MMHTSLAVLAMSASMVAPLTHVGHLHSHPKPVDGRVNITLYNQSAFFRDVSIDGKVYTIQQHHSLNIKAPTGTVVRAASLMSSYHRGDTLLEVKPEMDHQVFRLQ